MAETAGAALVGARRRIVPFLIAGAIALAASRADSGFASADCLSEVAEAGTVEAVDARAIRLDDGRVLRFAGIEPFNLFLEEAEDAEAKLQARLGEIIENRMLRFQLVARQPDRYGRLPAVVLAGEDLVQELAVRDGLAIAFASGDTLPCFDRILTAEAAARREHRGFWKGQRLPAAFPPALASRIGRFAIFEGRIVSVGNRFARSYLNFGTWWAEDVTVEITSDDRESFGGEAALAALAGLRVRVRGFVEEKSGPMVVVGSPMQLEVLDATLDAHGNAP